jgi:hypothetical protein
MDRCSNSGKSSPRRERKKREDQRTEGRRKKIKVRDEVEKSKHCVFPMFCGSGGSKSKLAKAAGAEPSGEMNDEQLHAVVAPSRFCTSRPELLCQLKC